MPISCFTVVWCSGIILICARSATSQSPPTGSSTSQTTVYTVAPGNDARDCSDILADQPSAQSGNYTIKVGPTDVDVEVYCDMETNGGGWTVFQRRLDGSVDFYRNWAAYAAGFGSALNEYWLGNDNIAAITAEKDYILRIDMKDWAGVHRQVNYSSFAIGAANTNYKLSKLGDFNGDAGTGDGLSYSKNARFSTSDNGDNLLILFNCALSHRSGYWFRSGLNLACSLSNLNGQYNNTQINRGVNWNPWKGSTYSLKSVEMKIRPA